MGSIEELMALRRAAEDERDRARQAAALWKRAATIRRKRSRQTSQSLLRAERELDVLRAALEEVRARVTVCVLWPGPDCRHATCRTDAATRAVIDVALSSAAPVAGTGREEG